MTDYFALAGDWTDMGGAGIEMCGSSLEVEAEASNDNGG
jgi:hypothetical protein